MEIAMNIHPAKSLSLVEILDKIKHTPNPMHDQTIIELVCTYLKEHKQDYTPFDARRWIKIMSENPEIVTQNESEIRLVKKQKNIKHPALLFYLKQQKFNTDIAKDYFSELKVYHPSKQKHYFVLGFPHEKDGFVIANTLFEDWIGETSISFIKGQNPDTETIHIFHTIWDYLSLLSDLNTKDLQTDTIILNSYDCISMVRMYLKQRGYRKAYSWLSNDVIGEQALRKLSAILQEEENLIHIAMNAFYQSSIHFKDWYQRQTQSSQ